MSQQLKQKLIHEILDKYQNKSESLFYLNQNNVIFGNKRYENIPNYVIEQIELEIREDKQHYKKNGQYTSYLLFRQHLFNNLESAQYRYEITLSGAISTCLLDNSKSSPVQQIIQSNAECLQLQLKSIFPRLNNESKKSVLVMQLLIDAQFKTHCFFAHNRKDIEHEGNLFKNIPGPIVNAIESLRAIEATYQAKYHKPSDYKAYRDALREHLSCFEGNESFYNTHLESDWAVNLYRNPEPIFQSYEPPKQTIESEFLY
ncbi:hypothetical protein L3V82_04500 [Thiotrichales bacterium 19S3-7]|nr:hypothetical protein [Thiotrichales bacterium 19S3-7]MCF6801356.1 hypothetical protein [Thiotrichales bacterium 19S3-11]